MKNTYYTSTVLVDRLYNASQRRNRPVMFLVGSPLSLPDQDGGHGVPGVSGMIDLIREEFKGSSAEAEFAQSLEGESANRYQKAFTFLHGRRGQDDVNRIVRTAVWRALDANNWPPHLSKKSPQDADAAICQELEDTVEAWVLPRAVDMLGNLLATYSETFGRAVLTTNFDPLIEVSVSKHRGQFFRTVLHDDGNLGQTVAKGTHIVHLHGYWYGSDTLHTPQQLVQSRPQLSKSLARVVEASTLVVLGYSGWDDVVTRTLVELLSDSDSTPDIIWAFHAEDATTIEASNERLLALLAPGIGRGRVSLYRGIDCCSLLNEIYQKLRLSDPAASGPTGGPRVIPVTRDDSDGGIGQGQVHIQIKIERPQQAPGTTSVGNSSETTVVTNSPGTMVIDRDLNSGGDTEEARPPAFPDPITQKAHTDQAEKALSQILILRAFDPPRARQNIQALQRCVGDKGDLLAASTSTKNTVLYWTARLCADDPETPASVRRLRDELRQTAPGMDLSIVDALLAEADGGKDEALRLLRDCDDPDPRTALFALLIRAQGRHDALAWYAEQAAPDDSQFFTPVGWKNWAVCMAKVGRWTEAAQRLLSFKSHWQQMPALAFVEGIINAAMLLPDEHRERALEAVPVYLGVTPTLVAGAEKHHARAVACFEFAEQSTKDIADPDLAGLISDWRLWLRLMDPNTTTANVARDEIGQDMEEGVRAVELMLFAYAFNILFNVEPLRRYLEHRKQLGGLNDRECRAECLIAQRSMSPRDLVTYLEQHKTRLSEVMPLALVTTMRVYALVNDNQTKKARTLVAAHATALGEAQARRLTVRIDECEGNDPREQLELSYHQTGSLVDLKNLAGHLKIVNDHAALQPLLRDLFDCERTVENAQNLVTCFGAPPSSDYEAIVKFLEENPDILERSDELKEMQAWALFQAGQLQESKEINDKLLSKRTNPDDLHLDMNIALASGDWERVAAILDREWPKRDSRDPGVLMRLALFAGQQNQAPSRALQLAKLAAEKAPDDPHMLMAAYWLHVRLGHDDEVDPAWLQRAYALSSTDQGPVWSVNLQDAVTEWLPARRDHLREVEQKWLNGEILTSMAAGRFNMPLAHFLLHIPDQNTAELDGRRRMMLPIIAGARAPIELQDDWTIGLDVTSIMVLAYLGLLEEADEAFHHVKLSPDIMEGLFRDQNEARFHQPSRIAAAEQVHALRSRDRLRAAGHVTAPPRAITDEVGMELATLLHLARQDNGKVICVPPLYKAGSLMEEQADISGYDALIHSPMDLCEFLYNTGKIAAADYQRASRFLCSQGKTAPAPLTPSILEGPIYVARLALSYLQDAGILQPMATAGLDIRIHPDVLEEVNVLIETGDVGEALVTKMEGIRHTLRNVLDSEKASFLPRTAAQDGDIQNRAMRFQETASLLAGSAACDALCIDDRFINRHPVLTEPPERAVPLVCVLDVLRYLVSRGHLSVADHWSARHKLRQSGFAFIPPESDELAHWLTTAKMDNGQLKESLELRIIRQATVQMHSLGFLTPEEALALSVSLNRVGKASVIHVWEDESLAIEQATALSDWVWHHLMAVSIGSPKHIAQDHHTGWMRDLLSLRLGSLLLPTAIKSHDRRAHYTRWLDHSVLEPLRPANADLIETALASVREGISVLEDGQELLGRLFLEQLPETARRLAIAQDAEFAHRCGFETSHVSSIGPDIKLVNSKLFAAAREVFATKKERIVQDIAGKDVSVGLQSEDQHVVVQWTDDKGVTNQTQIPDLVLLSPNREVRHDALSTMISRLGPTATDFRELLNNLDSHELTDHELTAIFEESTNGVMAVYDRLVQKMTQGLPLDVFDIIPQSVSYFERFVGPNPGMQEPESYFSNVLVPHRKALLTRDIRAGLDICCLSALRDDLTPGQWMTDLDDDVVWDALSSCHATSNPFALLGALDVALYRQEDERFREFAAAAVAMLLDERFGQQGGLDIYNLLQMLYEFVLNRINLLERGATYPGYWKRLGAWMQAGMIARIMMKPSFSIEINDFQKWLQGNMATAGAYADFVQARQEPMLLSGRILLRKEILGRLYVLTSRHEREGRYVPQSEDIGQMLTQTDEHGQPLVSGLPGPLEGHRRPTAPVPQEVTEKMGDIQTDGTEPSVLYWLATLSQFFALDEAKLERAREAVKAMGDTNYSTEPSEHLKLLGSASIVAAANRNTPLADEILDALVRIVPRLSTEEISMIPQIMLQAAAVHEAHDAWFTWLEEGLARIATHLPAPPDKSLQAFLVRLGGIERVLPLDSWFHLRARAIALAGAA